MDAVIRKLMPKAEYMDKPVTDRPSQEEVEAAVYTLLRWTGDNPEREGLKDTPKRVAKAFREMFGGYDMCPAEELGRTFEEVAGYDDLVLVKDIGFHSHCEHHMVPIIGVAHIAYLPDKKVVGLSKLARLLDVFAKRLQTQELMTQQIADCIEQVLAPHGIAVIIDAAHECMSTRGVHKSESTTITTQMRGIFRTDAKARAEVLALISNR